MNYDMELIAQIGKLQSKYRDYIQKANDVRSYYNEPTALECQCLQAAADVKSKLVQISKGRNYEVVSHVNDLEEVNKRIRAIRAYLDPDSNKNNGSGSGVPNNNAPNNNNSSSNSSNSNGNASSNSPADEKGKKSKDDDDDIDTSEWHGEKPKIGLDDVSGMENVKEKLKTCMVESELKRLAERLELQVLNSFFFVGPPGCGKTHIIKAFVHDLMEKKNYNYLTLDCSQVITKYVGDSEKIVKKIFEEAVKCAPCILFIDEIDGMCKNRSNPLLPEYASSLTTAFLTSYNIIKDAEKEIVFIGATNYPRNVDEAMMDRVEVVYVGLPDEKSRENAFIRAFRSGAVKDGKTPLIYFQKGLDAKYMASKTRLYNYRDIDRLIENIKKQVFNDLTQRLFEGKKDMDANEYVDKTIRELDKGVYTLSKKTFDSIVDSFVPSNKTGIIKDIKEWMDEMRSDDSSDGVSTFPNLGTHPDFLEDLEAEISGTINKVNNSNVQKDTSDSDVEEDDDPEEETETNEAYNDVESEEQDEKVESQFDYAESEDEEETKANISEEPKKTPAIDKVTLCADEFSVEPDGQVKVSFYIPVSDSKLVIAFINSKLYQCTVEDSGLCEFYFTPDEDAKTESVRIMDSNGKSYGEHKFSIVRGLEGNSAFDDF